ncbi:hypothetical protein NQD34_006874 [Periophthalmus magnuspinnatus]|nr:hypothetical protein NQD34_006874 [Periophthalmus magnuspinnatus]
MRGRGFHTMEAPHLFGRGSFQSSQGQKAQLLQRKVGLRGNLVEEVPAYCKLVALKRIGSVLARGEEEGKEQRLMMMRKMEIRMHLAELRSTLEDCVGVELFLDTEMLLQLENKD